MSKLKIIFSMIVFLSLFSCDGREEREYDEDGEIVIRGELSLSAINFDLKLDFIGHATNETRASKSSSDISADNFIVKIINQRTSEVVHKWLKKDVPATIPLQIGTYVMDVVYPEIYEDGVWEQPAYYGSETFKIEDAKTTSIDAIVCKPSNMKISVIYDSVFADKMKDYSTVVSSNSSSILTFSKDEKRVAHFNPATLLATVKGTMLNGEPFSQTKRINNGAAADYIIINVNAVMSGEGIPSITVDATTNDKNIDFEVEDDDVIVDPDPDPEPDPDPDPEPEDKQPTISGVDFDITQVMRHQFGESAVVDVLVTAENGNIQILNVDIDSPTLKPILDAQNIPSSFDLANLSDDHKKLFEELELIKAGEPVKGVSSFQFSIGAFMGLLPKGQHKFEVSVKDGGGVTVEEILSISVN